MRKNLLIYGLLLAVLMVVLEVTKYRFLVLENRIEIYIGIIAIVFVVMGAYMGRKLTTPKEVIIEKLVAVPTTPSAPFILNETVLDKLGISKREHEVLQLMAEGMSNQEIADKTFVSVNTVKTHVSNVLLKLDAKRRTQAVIKARELSLIP
ncbi:MAG: response regulator transcription factor [Bacteroidetes bacterium]|nr:response regulator transcription factor [Bacteroidota bacterium]